ncbi:hypothetical protein HanIR_Chr07g0315391 [Helianthus annuus]|nr:hypothetical protein HanIR_Chr07g0315391 [Helianthus annuus]
MNRLKRVPTPGFQPKHHKPITHIPTNTQNLIRRPINLHTSKRLPTLLIHTPHTTLQIHPRILIQIITVRTHSPKLFTF